MSIGIVHTSFGPVQGVELTGTFAGLTQFRNIPYAAPPVGALRFAPPVDPAPWTDVRVCDSWPPAAIQTFFPGEGLYPLGRPERSEDCLYLNVTTGAESADEKRPVFIWYHDGGLSNGYSFDPRNDHSPLAKKGIVVVSVGHRLAEFGYMALPQLTAEQGQSGNYGLMDTVKALQWVHENIARFGGDPDNVTIGGESGGCAKCCALAGLKETRGLFRRVINQSGLYWLRQFHTQEEAEKEGTDYIASMGIDPDISLEALRALDTFALHNDDIDPHFLPGQMTIDDKYFDRAFKDCFFENCEGLDFLNCACAGEGDPCYDKEMVGSVGHVHTAEQFYAHFRRILGDLYDKYDFESLVHVTDDNAWEQCLLLTTLGLSWERGHSNAARNVMVNRIFGKRIQSAYGKGNIYTLRFKHLQPALVKEESAQPKVAPSPRELPAAPHGSDNAYSSLSLASGIYKDRVYGETDVKVAEMFNEYLANFIKTGDPNGEGLVHWPRSNDNYGWLDLTVEPKAHDGLECKLDELIFEHVSKEYEI